MQPEKKTVQFFRRDQSNVQEAETLAHAFSEWHEGEEAVLIIVPHDDDAVLGAGMLLQQFLLEKVPLAVAITTDGRSGYSLLKDKDSITEIRQKEATESFKLLGVDKKNVHWLGFPDADLGRYRGRRRAVTGDPKSEEGFTGIEDGFVRVLRRGVEGNGKTCPITRVFVPSPTDYHYDHVVTAEEVPISLFHATGDIWPELGKSLVRFPYLYHFCVYCDLPQGQDPNILLVGTEELFQKKLQAIRSYASQTQIAALVKGVEEQGAYELFREIEFRLVNRRAQAEKFLGV